MVGSDGFWPGTTGVSVKSGSFGWKRVTL